MFPSCWYRAKLPAASWTSTRKTCQRPGHGSDTCAEPVAAGSTASTLPVPDSESRAVHHTLIRLTADRASLTFQASEIGAPARSARVGMVNDSRTGGVRSAPPTTVKSRGVISMPCGLVEPLEGAVYQPPSA